MRLFPSLIVTLISASAFAAPAISLFEPSHPQSQLINSTASSCYSQIFTHDHLQDVPARHFKVSAPTLMWRSTTEDLHITNIHIEVGGFPKGNPQSFDIRDEELRALFDNNNLFADNLIPRARDANTPSEKILTCELIVGGIQLTPAQDIFFVASGFVTLQGFTRDDAGEETEIETAFEFDLQNGNAPN